jgi:predicted DNA-binding ribbon-helix-helix protein
MTKDEFAQTLGFADYNALLAAVARPADHTKKNGNTIQRRGRPRMGLTKKVSITLEEQDWNDLAGICRVDKTTMSALLRRIITQALREGKV